VASDGEIAFEGVKVVTPANATLVRDLTLRVPRGTNLLVTGPNGSGRTMIAH
jgi:ATP-binding cassette, subfamily D (ALD), member 3